MIFDSVKNLETYKDTDARIYRGLKILETDLSTLADGRYEVDGENLFYMIQSYETKPENAPEAHRKYVDIQCVLSGAEKMGIGALEGMTETQACDEKDFRLYTGPLDYITLTPGKFAVLWPQDAHAPAVAVDQPAPVHKIVIKIKIAD